MSGGQGLKPWNYENATELAEELRPYWHRHRLPVHCGRCGRRITTIHRDCGHVLGDERHEIGGAPLPALILRARLALLGQECDERPPPRHEAWGWQIPEGGNRRITFVCRCGAEATRRMDRLILDFVAARTNGRRKLIVGQGDHEVA